MSLLALIREFLILGATGFGTSMVPYFEKRFVDELKWIEKEDFLSILQIAQTLPGLNSTNMAVMIGDRLGGPIGAVACTLAMLLPGVLGLALLGGLFTTYRDNPTVARFLNGVAAAACGVLVATAWRLGKKEIMSFEVLLVLAAVVLMSGFQLSLPIVLAILVPIGVYLHRPGKAKA